MPAGYATKPALQAMVVWTNNFVVVTQPWMTLLANSCNSAACE